MQMMYLSIIKFSINLSILILSSFSFNYSKQSIECLAVYTGFVEGNSFCYVYTLKHDQASEQANKKKKDK